MANVEHVILSPSPFSVCGPGTRLLQTIVLESNTLIHIISQCLHWAQLTYLGAWTSATVLKMTSKLLGRTPASPGSPFIVYVLPELVIP